MEEAVLKAHFDRIFRCRNNSRELSKPLKIYQQWSSNVTYIGDGNKWGSLTVIIDLFSRKVEGWDLSSRLDTDLIMLASTKVVRSRRTNQGLLFHTDRVRHYRVI
ncbi:DDE-type integrase/transposase/recombinase [Grimontia celer]|uniref:DDE-type integrase/transposase/recombinase n=1 Tax=Grimontia celer TaxID=1796497 RepID=UPI0012FB3458